MNQCNLYAPAAHAAEPVHRGAKKAVIIGCNYGHHGPNDLEGAVTDARAMYTFLTSEFGFTPNDIRLLIDEQNMAFPTRRNIIDSMHWLVNGAKDGDSLFFHFSGHGTRTTDYSGDERDNKNECLLPVDYLYSGVIVDDDINRLLVNPIPAGCRLHALFDCCHSGTMMDLKYSMQGRKKRPWTWQASPITKTYKGTSGGIVVQLSSCSDDEKAAELRQSTFIGGAATCAFIDAFRENKNNFISYETVLHHMYFCIKSLRYSSGLDGRKQQGIGEFFKQHIARLQGESRQRPMLSCNTNIDVGEAFRI